MLRKEMIDSLPAPIADDHCTEKETVFKKLEVTTPVENTKAKAAVIIHLGGATVEISEGTSQQTIQAVLLALQSIC